MKKLNIGGVTVYTRDLSEATLSEETKAYLRKSAFWIVVYGVTMSLMKPSIIFVAGFLVAHIH